MAKTQPKKSTYGEFLTALESGDVTEFTMQPDQGVYEVKGKMKGYKEGEEFITMIPPNNTGLQTRIDEAAKTNDVKVLKAPETSGWVNSSRLIPFIIIFILFFFLLNQAQGGGSRVMNFGKSKAKLYEEKKKVRLKM